MQTENELLEDIFVVQVLTLAMAMKTREGIERIKTASITTNDFIKDAIAHIKRQKSRVLELLNKTT